LGFNLSEVAVRVVAKKSKGYVTYNVALPKRFAEELGYKGGDILHVRVIEYEVNGRRVKGIFYYKP